MTDTLRRELHTIELDLELSSVPSSTSSDKKKSQVSKIGQGEGDISLNLILQKLEAMNKRLGDVEKEVKRANPKDQLPLRSNQNDTRNYIGTSRGQAGRGYHHYGRSQGQYRGGYGGGYRGGNRGGDTYGQSYPNREGYGGYRDNRRRDLNQ